MYKLNIDLEERKRQIKALFNVGLISTSTYIEQLQDIRSEEQAGVLEYNVTDEEMSEYWS